MLSPTDPKTSIDANQSIGVLKQYEKTSSGITGIADNGKFEVVVYSQSIIRIRFTKREEFDDLSYAVIATPDLGEYEIIESPVHTAEYLCIPEKAERVKQNGLFPLSCFLAPS